MLGNAFELSVNFDDQIVSLFKEIRYLSSFPNLHFPNAVLLKANNARGAYPLAVSLTETFCTYRQTLNAIRESEAGLGLLTAGYLNDVHDMIRKGTLRYQELLLFTEM